ncbi:MAG: hypothetical protein GPJ54_07450 [Candidatus Heimdallarchaeota archaeon]|nr:hypothetical protein [Candidatus Heimdallarchaeota archaeon]
MNWKELELIPLLNLLSEKSKGWDSEDVIPTTLALGHIVKKQLQKYNEGNYRTDRNEITGFFDAIEKFSITQLPITLDHFQSLINDYKKRIHPYPHYSGIVVSVPENLANLKDLESSDIPK